MPDWRDDLAPVLKPSDRPMVSLSSVQVLLYSGEYLLSDCLEEMRPRYGKLNPFSGSFS